MATGHSVTLLLRATPQPGGLDMSAASLITSSVSGCSSGVVAKNQNTRNRSVHFSTSIYDRLFAYVYIYTYINVHVIIYNIFYNMCVCVHMYIIVYIYTYTHTHIYIYTYIHIH